MQGQKDYSEKLFTNFQLSQRVPENNFYSRLKEALQLNYLYKETRSYYGDCGQKSIDPVVFFKLCLVGYLENIISDRQLIEHCSMRLDILYFLGYNIDEPLPWHSTVSRTRQLFPVGVFEKTFERVLEMCIDKGMVSGHTQSVDSALVKANASMDSLELKVPAEELDEHLRKVRVMNKSDRKPKTDKSDKDQRQLKASKEKLQSIKSRQEHWAETQEQRAGAGNKFSKYTSNHTHYSPTDPDAKIAVKPGKPRQLAYMSQLGVDSSHHVITHIKAVTAEKKDSQVLIPVVEALSRRLHRNGLLWSNVLADAGYSSGENYAALEQMGLRSFIPPHGTYKGGPKGFSFDEVRNAWICPEGKAVTYRKTKAEKGSLKHYYLTRRSDCAGCPLKQKCIGKSYEKRIAVTVYREEYERAIARVKSREGQRMKKKRQSTVEPVFGTLINFTGMRKVNTLGIENASKVMLMAAMAYNLKKYLKFTARNAAAKAESARAFVFEKISFIRNILRLFETLFFGKREIELQNSTC